MQTESVRRRTCATYAGDMHALELHLLEAFETQLSITKEMPEANALVCSLISTSKRHAQILNELVNSLGDVEKIVTDKLKSAVAGFFGIAAGLVATVRPLAISKALRDNYTAINHAIVGYVMLCTTATSLKNTETKVIAEEFLSDWITLSQKVMALIPTMALKDLSANGINVLDFNAARSFSTSERWASLFGLTVAASEQTEGVTLPEVISELQSILQNEVKLESAAAIREEIAAPNKIIVEKVISKTEGLVQGHVDRAVVETIVKPVIVEETFRPEKIVEVQPIIHREIQAPEVHHIERHIYEKVEATGSHIVTNKPIVEEVIKPHIIEEVQEIIHRELPAPVIEKVEKHIAEVEVMPTLHTKEVILEKEQVLEADLIVEKVTEEELITKKVDVEVLEFTKEVPITGLAAASIAKSAL